MKKFEKVNRYIYRSEQFLEEGNRELKEGKPMQASEKLWNAVAQILKAYGTAKNYKHYSHDSLGNIVEKIVSEKGNKRLSKIFIMAEGFHRNFYEGHIPKSIIEDGVEDIVYFVSEIKKLL